MSNLNSEENSNNNQKKVINLIIVTLFLVYAFDYWGSKFLITLLAISFLIFFHELGHFLAAKHMGVKVNTFSIGFGEKILTKKIKGTEYAISSIPLGGYVSLKGQEDLDPNLRNYDEDSYNSIGPIKRIYILFAGPFFNLFLAFLIYIALGFIGVEKLAPIVGNISKDMPAAVSGINLNDKITKIDGNEIREWDDIKKFIGLKPVNIEILRDGRVINLNITPKIAKTKTIFGEDIQKPLIGISPKAEFVTIYHKGLTSIPYAFNETIEASKLIFIGLEKLVTGVVPVKEMGGIIRMTDITTKAAGISLSVLLIIVALISVNLGILNLLPIPVLDGGHIVFNIYELIFKKEVSQNISIKLFYAGMAFLLTLTAFTIINDIVQLYGANH